MENRKAGHVCAVRNCKMKSYDSKKSFFMFPKDIVRARKWLSASGREDLTHLDAKKLNTSYRLCGEHFEQKMFNNFKCNSLKPAAVPTIFPSLEGGSSMKSDHTYSLPKLILRSQDKYISPEKSETEEMTTNKRWREQDTIRFVKLYKSAESLWNPRHPGYRDKKVREVASNEIITSMNMPDFGIHELKNKIKNIRSTYAQELNKVKRASIGMEGGENYRTSLCWFNIADTFLKPLVGSYGTNGSGERKLNINKQLVILEEERVERYLAMALAVGDLFSSWEEWSNTLTEFEELTGHKFWKRRSRKVGAAKIRKELKPELIYYEVQLDCKVYHGTECVPECPPDCSTRCPATIKLRASEDGDFLRVSKLALDGVHRDTKLVNNNNVVICEKEDDVLPEHTMPEHTIFAGNLTYSEEEGRYITIPSFNLAAAASGSNSPEMYYHPLNIDAEVIKNEILEEEDDEDDAEYHHQSKKAKTDENGQDILDNQDSNASSSGEVKIKDEFFYFGRNVECQLRELPLEKALECQFKILEMLAQCRVPT